MKKFLILLFICLTSGFLLLEISIRVFGLAGETLPEANVNGNQLNKPFAEGTYVRGGLGEIRAHYRINSTGWNSILDYDSNTDTTVLRIALVGDSYIEGFHVSVENSIGRLLERNSGTPVTVHEFGKSGANFQDYKLMQEKGFFTSYDFVYILTSASDISATEPSFMGKGHDVPTSLLRKIYSKCHTIRYLNINRGLLKSLTDIFRPRQALVKTAGKPASAAHNPEEKFSSFGKNTFFLFEKGNLEIDQFPGMKDSFIEIEHQLSPYNFGFDPHWNHNGRLNCANAILRHLESFRAKGKINGAN